MVAQVVGAAAVRTAPIAAARIAQVTPIIQKAIAHPATPPIVKASLRRAIGILIGR